VKTTIATAVVAALIALLPAAPVTAASSVPAAAIDAAVAKALAASKAPGLSIAIERDGIVEYAHGYGYRDVEAKRPVDPGTYFEIGSVTKQFTAAAIALLAADGKLKLDAPVATYLPDAPHAAEITIRQLLNHVSGIPEYVDDGIDPYVFSTSVTPAQLYGLVANKPLAFKPGTEYAYSNTNYVILGAIVERVSGMSYGDFLHARVLRDPALREISYGVPSAKPVAKAYVKSPAYAGPTAIPAWSSQVAFSAGGLYATPSELVRWDDAFFTGRVVAPDAVATLTSAPSLPGGATTTYAAGWVRGAIDGHTEIWHNGSIPGFVAENAYFPVEHLAIAMTANMGTIDLSGLMVEVFRTIVPPTAAQLAAENAAAPGEDPAVTAIVKRVWRDSAAGTVDRTMLDDRMSAALTDDRIRALAPQLKSLGAPTAYLYVSKTPQAGYTVYIYRVQTPGGLVIVTLSLDAAGKIGGLYYRPG
jgi:CubicO group peptidase (beta-lactamase class C family)